MEKRVSSSTKLANRVEDITTLSPGSLVEDNSRNKGDQGC
jgi:hypothetical protein